MGLYEDDLAYVHAAGFGAFAEGVAPAIVERLRASARVVRRVIDVGCGSGVTTRALVDAGFDVLGIEPSAALLAMARAAAPSATFLNASVYDVELGAADAILALGEPLTYHPRGSDADARVSELFRRAAGALPTGGLFVFDVICTGDPPLDATAWRSGADWAILYRGIEDRDAGWLTREIETFRKVGELYRRMGETHHVRVFDEAALTRWLDDAGFDVESGTAYGSYALAPRRRAFVATRR